MVVGKYLILFFLNHFKKNMIFFSSFFFLFYLNQTLNLKEISFFFFSVPSILNLLIFFIFNLLSFSFILFFNIKKIYNLIEDVRISHIHSNFHCSHSLRIFTLAFKISSLSQSDLVNCNYNKCPHLQMIFLA